jgi:PmbA protein
MDQQAAVDYVLSLAREDGEPDVDLIVERSEQLSLRVLNGQVEKIDQATALGLGIRVVHQGRTGVASTERLEPAALEKAFRSAKENALLNDPTEVVLPQAATNIPDPQDLRLLNPDIERLTVDELGTFGLEIESTARQADTRVTAVPYLGVSRSSSEYRIVSSHGVDYQQRQNSVGAYCQALLEDGERRKSGGHMWAERAWDPGQSTVIGSTAVRKAADLLTASSVPGGQVPVVLDEYCAPQLIGLYLGCFSAEAAQKGQSRLQGRLGEMIADGSLDLTAEPHRVGAGSSRYMDAEGIPTRTVPLIANGRFEEFMYHIESARRDGRESNGHAGRSYGSGIVTSGHNIVMPIGSHSLDALVGLPEKCLLVTELEGAAGCNPLSGDISIGVQGFWIENGERKQAVDSVTIAGNFFDVLKAIRARGNIYQPNLSRMFIPAVLVDGLTVSS